MFALILKGFWSMKLTLIKRKHKWLEGKHISNLGLHNSKNFWKFDIYNIVLVVTETVKLNSLIYLDIYHHILILTETRV